MSRALLSQGEIAVVGLGRSGVAASRLLRRQGVRVYASDGGDSPALRQEAALLRQEGVDAETGRHDLARIGGAATVVASPGIPPVAAPLAAANAAGVPVISEVEVALAFLRPVTIIAVTGTNGKSTVTALVDHLLRAIGRRSIAAGNIGLALSEVALRAEPPDFVSLEMSSFQLHDTPSLQPTVGVLTNLAPDHLDRYNSVEAYYADKDLLFRNAVDASTWVTNEDDTEVQRRTRTIRGRHFHFSLHDVSADAGPATNGRRLKLLGRDWMARTDVSLLGEHNVANVLAAALAVAGVVPMVTAEARQALAEAVRSFPGLAHRLELVAERGGVQWINDSKATNVSSSLVAINSMTRPTVVLLGGRHKGEPYVGLRDALMAHARLVVAYGEAASLIEHDLQSCVPLRRLGSSFDEVIASARSAAKPGDAILLSPACSSYDMFTNFEERGAQFRRLAAE